MTGIDIPKQDTHDSSDEGTPLSSSLPMEFELDHYGESQNVNSTHRNSVPVCSELETSLPIAFERSWFSRALSFPKVTSFFKTSRESLDEDMPDVFPDTRKLEKEKVIKVKSNRLKAIPDTLHRLKCVEELRITRSKFKKGDGITSIPLSIAKLDKLRILDLRGNPLGTVTLAISHLVSLEELTLESCNLTDVPLINELHNLQRVILDNNKISNPIFSSSSKILYLSLVNNTITEYPHELPANLKTLDLSENFISIIPESLLTVNLSLTKLYLRENQLEYLPSTLCQLRQLKILDVSKNHLRQLPDNIGQLTSIVSLNISYNELTVLPKSIVDLSVNDTYLLCGENPLQKPPIEVGLHGLQSIKNYFKALDDSEEVRNKRLKLMLLGDARAGKTFLAKALSTCAEPDECPDETVGIDCFHWKHRLANGETLEVLIVDCAGQKKYLLTHQLFLSTGTIFAVVVNLSVYEKTDYQDKIGFWIDLIIAKVPHATILIIPTHLDLMNNEYDVKEKCSSIVIHAHNHIQQCKSAVRKMSRYEAEKTEEVDGGIDNDEEDIDLIKPTLPKSLKFCKLDDSTQIETVDIIVDEEDKHNIHLIPVSSRYTLPGLSLLRDQIVNVAENKELCPNIHRCVPESWASLEQFCKEERKIQPDHPILTIEEFDTKSKSFNSQEDYKEALRFADSMGHILFYENACCNLILLDPRWLFNLMKLLFTHHANTSFTYKLEYCAKYEFFQREFAQAKDILIKRALLSHRLLRCIWSDHITDRELFEQVLFLFKRYDLFFELPTQTITPTIPDDKMYLVTWFLNNERPADIKPPNTENKAIIVVRFETTGALPDGFFQRFITKIYAEHILQSCAPWNYGFKGLVRDGEVMCDYTRSELASSITLAAYASPSDIYHMWKTIIPIINVLENFMADWKGIKHIFHSVCPSCFASNSEQPFAWRLDPSKFHLGGSIHCYTEMAKVDKWCIFPPFGILSDDASKVEKERLDANDMTEWLEFKHLNRIAEKLSPHVTQLSYALDVTIGELERTTMTSHNLVLELIELWKRKSKLKVCKKLFLEALQHMHPYPVDVIEYLMSETQ